MPRAPPCAAVWKNWTSARAGAARSKLSPAEVTEFREKSTFAPADLMGKAWVQAVVTAVDAKGARVLLGKGYTGYIPVANMSWARTPQPQDLRLGAPAVRDARKVLNVNDLIMVSAAPVTVQAEGGKKGKAATKTVDFDPATASPQSPSPCSSSRSRWCRALWLP